MWSLVRKVYWILAVILISGCSGSGCSGCAGGALHEIPGGYPITPETRVPRSAQIRLTPTGLAAVQAIAPGLLTSLTGTGFNVPTSSTSIDVGQVVVCPAGDCTIHVALPTGVTPLQLAFQAPSSITADVRLVITGSIPIKACIGSCDSSCNGTFCLTAASPTIGINTAAGTPPYLGLSTSIAITRDTHAPRLDYHRADLVSPTGSGAVIQQTTGEAIQTADISCTGSWACGIINALTGTLISSLSGELSNALGPITSALAQKSTPVPPGCPTGTTASSGNCVYSDMTDVPDLLGLEGTGNFGALLSSVTPGLNAPATYLLASGDHQHDAQILNSGMSLDLFGAMQSGGHNSCVPMVTEPTIAAVPEWSTLQTNTIPGTTTTMDLGVGISQTYLNHALFQLWDSGLFCLGVGSQTSQELSASLFSLLSPLQSLRYVIFPNTNGPIAITLRPQQPPTAVIGSGANVMTNPLLTITFPNLALDFYTWSEERYVRFMTVTSNLTVPLDLQADATGLMPVLGTPVLADAVTTNSQLLSGDPAAISMALSGLVGTAVGALASSLPSITIPSFALPSSGGTSLGSIQVTVPAMGVQGVMDSGSNYLGLFANLTLVPPGMMHEAIRHVRSTASLSRVTVNRDFFHEVSALRQENLPRVEFSVASPDTAPEGLEYSYKIDQWTWSYFTSQRDYSIQHIALATQGTHTIQVRARVAGQPLTASTEPASFTFVIDTEPPHLHATIEGDDVIATALDDVSPTVEYAFQFDHGTQTDWTTNPRIALPTGVRLIDVLARDETGNVSQVSVTHSTALIRGGPAAAGGSGCGCRVGGRESGPTGLLCLLALLLSRGFYSRRQRTSVVATRRRILAPSPIWLVPLAIGVNGCGCSSTTTNTGMDGGHVDTGTADTGTTDTSQMTSCTAPAMLCPTSNMCVNSPGCPTCMAGYASMGSPTFNTNACTFDTTACTCTVLPPLEMGAIGTYLDMATATDGTVWLSAYSEGVPDQDVLYGDLIVGRLSGEAGTVNWSQVDGVPSGSAPTGDPSGWRGGISDAGPDVGRFTSIALTTDNQPRVTYWDVTNNQLKYAAYNGETWTTEVVDSSSPGGKYSSLVLLAGNVPAVVYRASVVHAGVVSTVVRVAKANNANPMGPTDWTTTDVVSTPTTCRASDCPTGTACQKSNGQCVATTTMCTASCTSTQACIGTACTDIYSSGYLEGIPSGALYTRMVTDTMGGLYVTWYDRDAGNLMLVSTNSMGVWGTPTILDGEGATPATGDRGIYNTLVYAPDGTLRIAYVDGWSEQLLYLNVTPGMAPGTPEVIDNGTAVGTTAFTDGLHIVGDSPSMQVLSSGTVQIVYGDSSAQTLRLAVRTSMGGTTPWTTSVLDSTNSTGYWANISGHTVATWWRDLSTTMRQWGVRVTQLP